MNIQPELQHILNTYASSKILRYGVAYLETEERFRHVLAEELGVQLKKVRDYALKVVYWPHTKPVAEVSACQRWSDEEDNLIMDLWQVSPKETVYQYLPHRTIDAVNRRASFLGVTRDLKPRK